MNNNITNGGLNIGEVCSGPHCAIPVEPLTANLIHNNLNSANPPPNANIHYPGTLRQGNNYLDMPGIIQYQGTNNNPGPFNIQVAAGKKDGCMCDNQEGGAYNYIRNPLTNRKVNINSALGKKIINNYIRQLS